MSHPVVLSSGSLAETPFLDVLMDAWSRDEPTIVEIARDAGRRSFWFREGELLALTSSSRSESFSAMLVKRKKLQSSVATAIDDVAAKDDITPAQVMLRDRVLPIPDLVREMSLWATLLLVETFGWTEADWRICADPPGTAPPETLLEMNLVGALRKGVAKRVSADDVRAMLRPHHHKRPRRVQPLPRSIVPYDLDAHEQAFWEAVDGGRTLGEILEFSSIPGDAAARLIYLLHRTGMITFADRSAYASAPGMDVGSAWDTPASPEVEAGDLDPDPDDLATDEEIPAAPAKQGIDMSQIRFHRTDVADPTTISGTMHTVAPHTRESVANVTSGTWRKVEVGVGHADEVTSADDISPAGGAGLDSLFSGLGLDSDSASGPPPIAKPGARQPLKPVPPTAPPEVPAGPDPNAPPSGEGPVIEQEDWDRLTTKDKDRVRTMRKELNKMVKTNFFEWFGLSPDSPVGSIKKAYFQMAKMYHPDSLLDEPEVFSVMAASLFANFSTAYETLSDDEARDKYIRKHIHGEKDENDLAMEQVQKILAAEASFKKGLRTLDRGGLKDALRHFKEALEGYPDEAEYLAYHGYVLFRSKLSTDPEGADEGMEQIKQATKMKELAPKPWHLLGKAHLAKGEPRSAKAVLRRALQLQPDNPEVRRDYQKADELEKSGGQVSSGAPEGGKKSLFGTLFGKKKAAPPPVDDDDGLDF